jgi:hypothetical protein
MGKSEHTLSKQDSVCTPEAIWQPIVDALGPIYFDPCSHPASTVPASTRILLPELYWTHPTDEPPEHQDGGDHDVIWGNGLEFEWADCGLVYVNPPYSTLGKERWIQKARDEADEAVLFVPVRTATRWWQQELVFCQAITFLASRVTHDNVYDKKGLLTDDPSPFGQALVYCGKRTELWCEKIGPLGWTVLGAKRA